MKSHKLKASNTTDHYLIDSPVTENDILIMAQKLARQSLAKGRLLTSPGQVFSHFKILLQSYEHEVFALCYSITNTGYSAFISCFAVLWMKPVPSTGGRQARPGAQCGGAGAQLCRSQADAYVKDALNLVGTRTLDHIVVGSEECVSLAERGYL